jgi:hypothetical protein
LKGLPPAEVDKKRTKDLNPTLQALKNKGLIEGNNLQNLYAPVLFICKKDFAFESPPGGPVILFVAVAGVRPDALIIILFC